MKSTDPAGVTYSVTRRWMPWRRRIKELDAPDTGGFGDVGGLADDPVGLVLLGVFALLALVLLLPGLLLLLGVAIETALLLALLPVAVLGRSAFGMPWEVEVRNTGGGVVWPVVHTEQVKGWGASGVRIADLAEEIRLGRFTLEPPATQSGS